jgi:cold shock CspA family protein
MATGTITWVNASKGHAFIAPDEGGQDLFVEPSRGGEKTVLFAGASVEFDVRNGVKGRITATNVALSRLQACDPEHAGGARVGDGPLAPRIEARGWS